MSRWEWKRPEGHDRQPLIEWWVEQIAVVIVLKIGKRAHRRGDKQTFNRMLGLSKAGAKSIKEAAKRVEDPDA